MKKTLSVLLIIVLVIGTAAVSYAAPVSPPPTPTVTEVKPLENPRPDNVTLENIKELSKSEKALELGLSALEMERQGKTEEANKFWILWQQENKAALAPTAVPPTVVPPTTPPSQIPPNQQNPEQQAEIKNLMLQINALSEQLVKAKETGDKTAYNKLSAEINKLQAKLNGLIKPNQPKIQPPQPPVTNPELNPAPKITIKEEVKLNLKEIEKYARSSSTTIYKLLKQLAERYNNLVNKYNDLQRKLIERERIIKELEQKLQNANPEDDNPTLDKLFDNTNKGK